MGGGSGAIGFEDGAADTDDVWLRKRLVDFNESTEVSLDDQLDEVSARMWGSLSASPSTILTC